MSDNGWLRRMAERGLARAISGSILLFALALTALRANFTDRPPDGAPRVFFANHSSHGDFVLVWAGLPPRARARARPVAASEYWSASALRRLIGRKVFDAVLIDRDPALRRQDPVAQMVGALDGGASLIVFPEGTRNVTDAALLPFRSGLYHLARSRPDIDLVPVWIANLNRVMPKGGLVPIPLICTVTFGAPLRLDASETKDAFLDRARAALLTLAPGGTA